MKLLWYATTAEGSTVGVKEVSRKLLETMYELNLPIQPMLVSYDSLDIYNLKLELSSTRIGLHKIENPLKLQLAFEIDELDQFCDYCAERNLGITPDSPEIPNA